MNFLFSSRLRVRAAKGMSEVRRTKRFELKSVKMRTLALIKCKGIMKYYGGKVTYRRELPFSNIAMPNFKGFFLGDFISERMRFSTTLGSRVSHAIICTSVLVHQAITVL
jgi:hypothetical protein